MIRQSSQNVIPSHIGKLPFFFIHEIAASLIRCKHVRSGHLVKSFATCPNPA